jgi:hypothetical protein
VKVLSVSARSIMIMHSGGMTSIRLRDLPPDLQSRFCYDPVADAAADAALQQANELAAKHRMEEPGRRERSTEPDSRIEDLLLRFGQKPEIRSEVDLRPRFLQLDFSVKDQGRRPSCAVFAVVSALEFQNAELTGHAEQFSEEYLVWATRMTLHRSSRSESGPAPGPEDSSDEADEGFSLSDVLVALRAYGVPPISAMPNAGYGKMADIQAPSPELINQARTHRRVFVHRIPGHDTATQINNIILTLDSGMPVAISLRWPNYRSIRAGFLSEQTPLTRGAHAVALIGYQSAGGQINDTVFLFRNSYGPTWGEAGYGRVTSRYLQNYLLDAELIEVQRPEAAQ